MYSSPDLLKIERGNNDANVYNLNYQMSRRSVCDKCSILIVKE